MSNYKVTELILSPDKIISIIKQHGEFSLTWHYRVDKTRKICIEMCKNKILYRSQHSRGLDTFIFHKNYKTNY
jgi:NAD-dependent dihydropyrimidine dehydrogenase PreA subunit